MEASRHRRRRDKVYDFDDDDGEDSDGSWQDEDDEEEDDEGSFTSSPSVSFGLSSGRSFESSVSASTPDEKYVPAEGRGTGREDGRRFAVVHRGGGGGAEDGSGEGDGTVKTKRKRRRGVRERVDGFVDWVVEGVVEYMKEEKDWNE